MAGGCIATTKAGTPCKGTSVRDGLCMAHLESAPQGNPTKLKGLRRARNLRFGLRAVKMLRPICRDGCQDGAEVAWDWHLSCPHDPYVGKREKRTQVPIYSEPHEDGSVSLEGMDERISWEPYPNFSEVTVSTRVNSGTGVNKARRKGFILPEELRSPLYPTGIAPMCQFKGCYWHEGLREYRYGTFCRELEARLVGFDEHDAEGNPLYGAMEVHHEAKRQKQLDAVVV